MPYQEIIEAILRSHEIRIATHTSDNANNVLVEAIGLVCDDRIIKLSLHDRGGYLDLDIVPILQEATYQEIADWRQLISDNVNFLELKQRWFVGQPSGEILNRFHGITIVGQSSAISIEVDDDVVGAFRVEVLLGS
ncbi:MAG TPA: hypothetical protein VFQ67_08775 [Allosphingosinicella sp.]|jgi:hypothetical protein|nr:hypothetical protein [Allosphingosinicella sp.]